MTSFLLVLQSNPSVLKERRHIPAGCGVGILVLHWQQCSAIFACPSVTQLCVTGAVWWSLWGCCPDVLKWHFFKWVNSKLPLPPFKVLWSTVLWHLSVGRCRCVSLGNNVLSHSFHTHCWFICGALNVYPVMCVWYYLEFPIQWFSLPWELKWNAPV